MKPVIETHDLCKSYNGRTVVDHLNLTVPQGCVYGFLGPNGAGKSTILKTVTRQLAELGGTIFLEGTSMSRMREEEVARTLAMVMTERLHPEFMTCREVVATGRYPYTGRLGILSAEDWKPCSWCMPGTPRTGIFHRSATDRDSG